MLDNICRFKANNYHPMKTGKSIIALLLLATLSTGTMSCSLYHSVFGPKYGCPSNGKNVGAERILSGEKVPRAAKFKA
jgi:hypothetical protein